MLPEPGPHSPYVVAESVEDSYQRILCKVSWMRQLQVLEHGWAWFLLGAHYSHPTGQKETVIGQWWEWQLLWPREWVRGTKLSVVARTSPHVGSGALMMEGFSGNLDAIVWHIHRVASHVPTYGLNYVPPTPCPTIWTWKSQISVPQNVVLFGDKVFTDIIKLKCGYQGTL